MGYSREDETKRDRFDGKFRSGKRLVEEGQKEHLTDKALSGGVSETREFPDTADEENYDRRHVGGDDVSLDEKLSREYDAIEARAAGTLVFTTTEGEETAYDVTSADVGRILPVGVVDVDLSASALSESEIVLYQV